MKKILLTLMLVSFFGFSPIFAQSSSQNLPPISELPKNGEVKSFHELNAVHDYQLFDKGGKLVKSGSAQFINTTDLKPGTYFIQYDGKTERLIKTAIQ